MRCEASVRQLPKRLLPVHRRPMPGQHARPVSAVAFAREGHGRADPLGARPARRGHDRKEEGNRQNQERIQTMNIPFTLTVHEDIGDIPSWMFFALCALPYVLLIIGIIG